ncbi:MAG TPA: hypothetical protein VNK41_02560 [Vicinamibacterales bacterium]|nr:hypothetical protein [Vicinamibacterales bacterium]
MTADPAAPGLSRRALATLAYLGGWATGVLVWLIERDDAVVRFHAAQSVLLFGGLAVLWLAVWVGSFFVLTFSAGGFTALQWLARGVLIGMAVAWVVVLWRSWRTQDWRLPIVSGPAERAARWRSRG